MGKTKYWLSPAMAEWVRDRRRAGATWAELAERLGWPVGNAQQNIEAALARGPDPAQAERNRAEREAERDPALSRRCAKCGRPNYTLVRLHGGIEYVAHAVGFVSLGGRWLCPDCAPRPRPTPEQALWGEAPVTYGPPA